MASYGTISMQWPTHHLGFALMGFWECCGNVYFIHYRESGHCCGASFLCTVCRLYGWKQLRTLFRPHHGYSLAAFIILVLAVALIVYSMTKSFGLGAIIGIAGVALLLVMYFGDSTTFQGAFRGFISALSLTGHFMNVPPG